MSNIQVQLVHEGVPIHTHPSAFDGSPQLVVASPAEAHGLWKTIQGTVAGTIIIATCNVGQGLVLTDLILTSTRKANSTLNVQFTDNTNDEIILSPETDTDRVNISANYISRIGGWSGARLEVVTVQDVIYTAFVGYYRIQQPDSFSDWDAKR